MVQISIQLTDIEYATKFLIFSKSGFLLQLKTNIDSIKVSYDILLFNLNAIYE